MSLSREAPWVGTGEHPVCGSETLGVATTATLKLLLQGEQESEPVSLLAQQMRLQKIQAKKATARSLLDRHIQTKATAAERYGCCG